MERLERISTGFTEAKILLTAAELRIFDMMKGEAKTAEEVRSALDGDIRGVRIFLDALCAMEILSLDDGRYRGGAAAQRANGWFPAGMVQPARRQR